MSSCLKTPDKLSHCNVTNLSPLHQLSDISPLGLYFTMFSSVQSLIHVLLFATPWTAAQPAAVSMGDWPSPWPSLTITSSWSYSNSCPLSRWCHPTISSSVVPFYSLLQSFPASGSLQMSQFLATGGQSIVASASVLPMKIQDWFLLGWTGWISFQSKGLSRVFSNTTFQNHQFFSTQLSW